MRQGIPIDAVERGRYRQKQGLTVLVGMALTVRVANRSRFPFLVVGLLAVPEFEEVLVRRSQEIGSSWPAVRRWWCCILIVRTEFAT